MLGRSLVIIAAGVLLVTAGCSRQRVEVAAADASVEPAGERPAAPDFSLKDSDGRSVKLSDYRGKVVLLNFWATWCGPCRIEIPWFTEFESTYKDRGFAVIGVSMDEEGWDIVKPYMRHAKMNYRVVIGNDEIASDYGGVSSLPTSFIIDQEGRRAATHVGLVSKDRYVKDIETVLNAGSPKQVTLLRTAR